MEKSGGRFWAGDSSEEGSDDNKSEASEGSWQQTETPKAGAAPAVQAAAGSRWQVDSDDSDVDEADRVVKSARDKAEDAFQKAYNETKNSLNINDWNNISNVFTKLPGLLTKFADIIQGSKVGAIDNYPVFYFLTLKVMQNAVEDLTQDKDKQKKLSKLNAKSFNAVKARLKKLINEEYEDMINSVQEKAVMAKEKPKDESEESESESDSDSESDSSSSGSSSDSDSGSSEESDERREEFVENDEEEAKKKSKLMDEESSSEEEWDEDLSSSSSEEEDARAQLTGRAKWLKTTKVDDSREKAEEKKKKDEEKRKKAEERRKDKESAKQSKERRKEEDFNEEVVTEKLKEIIASRGKKNIDKLEQIAQLRVLCDRSTIFGPKFRIPLLMHLVTLQFDVKSGLDEFMPVPLWKQTMADVSSLLDMIEENQFKLVQFSGIGMDDDEDDDAEEKKAPEDELAIKVVGDLSLFTDKLHNEYEKSLRFIDSHSHEYVERLQDESAINVISRRAYKYYLRTKEPIKASTQAIITLQNNYYKHQTVAEAVHNVQCLTAKYGDREFWHPAACFSDSLRLDSVDVNSSHPATKLGSLGSLLNECSVDKKLGKYSLEAEINSDCKYIFQNGTNEMKCVASLCQIYHYALHDKYHHARDLLLMSRLQESIFTFDVEAQILFNRTMAQLGFCAFRAGKIREAHNCLIDLCQQGSKTKELLSQGIYWRRQMQGMDAKALEAFQRAERRRLLPFHMHINLDLLEFFHLTSAMLLEIPNMAATESTVGGENSNQQNQRILSRTFRRHMEQYQRQVFAGPPENTRDHILAASMCMKTGDWKGCWNFLKDLSVWKLFQSRMAETKVQLEREIKLQTLRTFLLTYSAMYDSIAADQLCKNFDISVEELYKVVSKMIAEEELRGSWDLPDTNASSERMFLTLRSKAPTHLQALAGRFAEKLTKIVESNEKKANKAQGFDPSATNTTQGGNEDTKRGFKFRKGGSNNPARNGNQQGQRNYSKRPMKG